MMTIVRERGQIVIAAKLRKKFGISKGTRINVIDDGQSIVLEPISKDYVRNLKGMFEGVDLLKVLMEDREREKTH